MTQLFPARALGLVDDDLSDVARALFAVDDLFDLALELCGRPMVDSDTDRLSHNLRLIRLGLLAGRAALQERRGMI